MRNFFAFLLLLIFIPVFILAVLTWNIRSTLLNKEFVKNELSKNKIYEFVHEEVLPTVTEDKASEIPPNLLTTTELTNLAQDTITVDFLQNEAENLIDNVYPYLLSQEDSFEANVDLKEIKKSFGSNLDDFTKTKLGLRVPEVTKGVTGQLPDKIVLSNEGVSFEPKNFRLFEDKKSSEEFSSDFATTLANARETVARFNFVSTLLIASSVLILILIAVLKFGSVKAVTKWLGWTLILPSAFLLTLALFYKFFLINLLSGFLHSLLLSDASEDFYSIASFFIGDQQKAGFIFRVIGDINQQILIQMVVVSAVALILIISSSFIKTKPIQEANPTKT